MVAGMAAVQDYVERTVRQRLAALPDGSWETVDYIDRDVSGGEGMIPIRVKTTIAGDKVIYDFTGSHPTIGSIYNSAFGATFSACVAGMKTFFPDLPLNSGLYRVIEMVAPPDTVVEREMAGRRNRLPDALREDHELDLRDLVRHHAAPRDLLHLQH